MTLRDLVLRGKRALPVTAKDAALMSESSGAPPIQRKPTDGQADGHGEMSTANQADMVPQRPVDAESASEDADPALGPLAWDNLWSEAYETLNDDPEYTKLLEAFEKYVMGSNDLAVNEADKNLLGRGGVTTGAEKLNQIQKLAEAKLQNIPEARLSFSVGDKTIVVREIVRKTISVVTAFKDVITPAISAEPCAGLAWAGIMSILPLIGNSFQQDDDAERGLKNIVFLLIRYQRLQEEVLAPEFQRSSLAEIDRRVFSEIRTKLVSLYAQIYVYEIRFVLQYARGRVHRASRNAVAADNWKSIWVDIETTSQMIDQAVREHIGARTLETVNDIIARAEKIEILQQETLKSVKAGNQTQLILTLPCAVNAIFDSAEVMGKERLCLKGTRRDVLNRIQDWAESPTGEMIFWLYGMAGTGKTSVALSVATALSMREPFTEGRQPPQSVFLGASFFFKQGDTTRNGTKTFFSTIARRLAQEFPDIGTQIAYAVEKNLEIGTKAPQQQLDNLVFKPLSVMDRQTLIPVCLVIVIDALDECIEQKEVDDLIGMLRMLEDLHQVQLRVLITSRRDDHILRSFERLPIDMYNPSLLDKVRSPVKEDDDVDDITKYLIQALDKIAVERDVPTGWIDEDGIASLRKKADGLFIYAATMCRFLDCEDFDDDEARQDRLEQILADEVDTDAPQQKVDEIYLKVLSFPHLAKLSRKSQMKFHDKTKRMLGFITVFFEPVSVPSLSALLSVDKEELIKTLRKFHSIVDVPQDEQAPLGLVHLSFRDFLLSKERSNKLPFRVEEISMHQEVFEACLGLMSRELHMDMCDLVLPGYRASEVSQSQLERGVPPYLRYACRYWVDHLAKLGDDQHKEVGLADDKAVHLFLQEKLLFWLEAMSLMREMSSAILILNKLATTIDFIGNSTLSGFVYDARRFVLRNKPVIEEAPLQLYSSTLIFSPSKSKVRFQFMHLIPSWITQVPEPEEDWTSELNMLAGSRGATISVSFSLLDDLIVAGSIGQTAVWNYVTGTELYKFDESDTIFCVDFSPDGKAVASGSRDGMIRIREFAKGRSIDLEGHTGYVHSVAFSPKSSNTLASVSGDKTLRIWNIEEKREIHKIDISLQYASRAKNGQLLDIEFPARGAAFSPQGDFVAVGSNAGSQGSVTLWGVEKGELRTTFKGHGLSFVLAVAISSDGETVVSGSDDRTVKVWNAKTGQTRHETRYDKDIRTIQFCPPNGEQVIIGFSTGVEIRHANTWDLVGEVQTVSYSDLSLSRDGQFLARSTVGEGICLHDMQRASNDVPQKPRTFSLKFCPGKDNDVVTTSGHLLQLWDAKNMLIGSTPVFVRELKFSPDERFIGVGSFSRYVEIWSQRMARMIARYDEAYGVSFSPTSSHVMIQSLDKARIIDLTSLEDTAEIDCKIWNRFAFSPNGRDVAWVNERIHFLDLTTSKELVGPLCVSAVNIIFSPDGELAAVTRGVGEDRHISLIEVATGKERATFSAVFWGPAIFHPTGSLVAAGESEMPVWDTVSGDKIRNLKLDTFRKRRVDTLLFSGTGKLVVAAGSAMKSSSAIQLWDFETGTSICILPVRTSISDLAFSSDPRYLEHQVGRFKLPPPITATLDDASVEEAENSFYVGIDWVMHGSDRIFHIPADLVGYGMGARGDRVFFGCPGGRLTYLKVDLAKTPLASRVKAK